MNPAPIPRTRTAQIEALSGDPFDVLVIGGGITGVCAAHRLTSRGYRVALIDSHDFASGTSQESSQLVWGGIKYMENGHFKLVHGLCLARNALVRNYASRVEPIRFLYPYYKHDSHPRALLLLGMYLYWTLGAGFGGRPRGHSLEDVHALVPDLQPGDFKSALEYGDARMVSSDARATLDLLFDAMDGGLTAANHVSFQDANWNNAANAHEVKVRDEITGGSFNVQARWIVNTAGCWVDEVNARLGVKAPHSLCFSKGIHLIIPRIESSGRALTCLARDGRIFFVIPWGAVTLIGTTDTPFEEPPRRVAPDAGDIEYLLGECQKKFNLGIDASSILNTKAGLRPLLRPPRGNSKDFLALARSHKVWSDPRARVTALWGGKFTDAFPMADEIVAQIGFAPRGEGSAIPMAAQSSLAHAENFDSSFALGSAALEEACRRELVVKLEDLLRRRTNIALKVPHGGWGAKGEYAGLLESWAGAVARAAGRETSEVMNEYRAATQRQVQR